MATFLCGAVSQNPYHFYHVSASGQTQNCSHSHHKTVGMLWLLLTWKHSIKWTFYDIFRIFSIQTEKKHYNWCLAKMPYSKEKHFSLMYVFNHTNSKPTFKNKKRKEFLTTVINAANLSCQQNCKVSCLPNMSLKLSTCTSIYVTFFSNTNSIQTKIYCRKYVEIVV